MDGKIVEDVTNVTSFVVSSSTVGAWAGAADNDPMRVVSASPFVEVARDFRATVPSPPPKPSPQRIQAVALGPAPEPHLGWLVFFSILLAPVAAIAGIVSAARGKGYGEGFLSIGRTIVGALFGPPANPAGPHPSFMSRTQAARPKEQPTLPGVGQEVQDTRAAIAALLSADPLPPDYKRRIAAWLAPLSASERLAIGQSLAQERIYLPNLTLGAPAVEDATARIRYSYMSWSSLAWQNAYVADMLLVARTEGFKLVLQLETGISERSAKDTLERLLLGRGLDAASAATLVRERVQFAHDPALRSDGIWAEDNKWASRGDDLDDEVRITTLPSLPSGILDIAERYAQALEPTPRGFQGAVTGRGQQKNARVLAGALKRPIHTLRGYNEGGNMLAGTLPDGSAYAILGKDALVISTFLMLRDKAPELEKAQIDARLAMLQYSDAQLDAVASALGAAGHPMGADRREAARRFLAAQDIVTDVLAKDLHIPRKNLCFVSQPEFHIDMFMRPLAPGVVLLNDDKACVELLDRALAEARAIIQDPNASASDKAAAGWQIPELVSMREESARLAKQRGALVAQIKMQLLAAGLQVVSAPGVMKGSGEAGTRHVNFMNAVPGSSAGRGQFYATNATSLPLVRDGFVRFMRAQGVDRVYFIGTEGGGEKTLNAAEHSLGLSGGLDCLENHHDGLRAILPTRLAEARDEA